MKLILFLLLFSGCDMFSFVSSPVQERGVTGFFSDNVLRFKISTLLASQGLKHVDVMAHKGRILLVGNVQQQNSKNSILLKIKQMEGITQVIDEIKITPINQENLMDYSKDAWLGQKLKALLFFDVRIFSQNYHVCVVDKVAYILGTAQDQAELTYVTEHAESLSIRRIVPYVNVLPSSLPYEIR